MQTKSSSIWRQWQLQLCFNFNTLLCLVRLFAFALLVDTKSICEASIVWTSERFACCETDKRRIELQLLHLYEIKNRYISSDSGLTGKTRQQQQQQHRRRRAEEKTCRNSFDDLFELWIVIRSLRSWPFWLAICLLLQSKWIGTGNANAQLILIYCRQPVSPGLKWCAHISSVRKRRRRRRLARSLLATNVARSRQTKRIALRQLINYYLLRCSFCSRRAATWIYCVWLRATQFRRC